MADTPKSPVDPPLNMNPTDDWAQAMGLEIVSVKDDEVVIEWTVERRHLQPFGLVHGGVHAGVVETACSIGAGALASKRGQTVVGVENHTSFLRAVKAGRLRATARPLQVGRRAQLWQTDIVDEAGKLVATGRVRLFALDPAPEAEKPAE